MTARCHPRTATPRLPAKRPARAVALALLLMLLAPTMALAHPLGNFTVNHYSRIEPVVDGVRIAHVLDLAEIPTFQEQPSIDVDRDGQLGEAEREQYADRRAEELRRNLQLRLDEADLDLRLVSRTLSFPPGQGGLPTLRLEAVYRADLPIGVGEKPIRLTYRDANDPDRIGWREIVARGAGADVLQTSVPTEDRSDELRSYSEDLLASPLNIREAQLTFVPRAATAPADPPAATAAPPIERPIDVYAALAAAEDLSLSVILFSLGTAMVLGALHALSPGHGKTVVAAYLIGSRGTARHAMFLGATVTATHTAGVYALGLVTLYLSQYVLPERLYPILEVVSGLLVVGIGGWLFVSRLRGALAARRRPGGDARQVDGADGGVLTRQGPLGGDGHAHVNGHEHAHAHGHAHDHAHEPAPVALAAATVGSSVVEYRHRPGHAHGDGRSNGHDRLSGHEHPHGHGHPRHDEHPHDDGHDHDHEHPHDDSYDRGDAPTASDLSPLPVQHRSAPVHRHGGRAHSHLPPGTDGRPVTWRSLLALGISGGLLPCPSALVVLLSAIALHRVAFGLLLIVAFSLGLASVLVGIGLLLVYARRLFERVSVGPSFAARLLPVASALVIVVAGLVITGQALPKAL